MLKVTLEQTIGQHINQISTSGTGDVNEAKTYLLKNAIHRGFIKGVTAQMYVDHQAGYNLSIEAVEIK